MLDTLRGILEPAGYRLQEPMDWQLLSEEVGIFGADVVLLGDRLRSGDAARSLRRLKDPRRNDCAVIVLAAEAEEGAVTRWLDAEADDVISGPIIPRDLLNRIGLQLEVRNQAKASEALPELLYVSPADASDDVSAPRPPDIPEHLPTGLDSYYEPDLYTIIEASEAFASSLSAEDALFVIVRRLAKTIPVSRCNVTVRGVKNDEVIVVASHDDANMRSRAIKLSRYPEIRRCLEGGELVLIEDVHADDDMRVVLDFIKSVDLRSALVLPLYVKEVAVGALSLTSRRAAHGFTQRELLFTRVMANMAAGVIAAGDIIERLRRGAGQEEEVAVFDEVVLGVDEAIEGLIEELERK
ncbi:MAG: GAF domain-containing protein [Deltaproteobacteria bacterium]|nr:GAF domain-containing protein [Deltaproteobacteria bacterium]